MVSRTDVKKSHILFKGSAEITWLLIGCPFKNKLSLFSYQIDRQQATGKWDKKKSSTANVRFAD
jgi:hypothetical protein